MRPLRILCSFFVLFLTFASYVQAQDDPNFEVGLKPYGAHHAGNIDNVNLGNGSLGVDIPLISYPQRGGSLKLDFALHYFNASLYEVYSCIGSDCYYTPSGSYGGFQIVDRQAFAFETGVTFTATQYNPCTVTNPSTGSEYCNLQVSDTDGSSHLYAPTSTADTSLRSIDSTAILGNGVQAYGLAASVTDAQGIVHSNLNTGSTNAASDSREDANGNEITHSSTAGWTDTMGRTIPIIPAPGSSGLSNCPQPPAVPQAPASASVWNPPGLNGGTYTITFCYANLAFTVPYSGSLPYLQSVVLPDGTAWNFAYAQTQDQIFPNFNLTQITFPTGGTLSYTWGSTDSCPANYSSAANMAVLTRALNPNDGVSPISTWTYSYAAANGYSTGVTTVTDPAGNVSTHAFGVAGPPGTTNACYLYENQAKYYQGSNTLLKTVNTTYSYSLWNNPLVLTKPAINVVPTEIDTIWANGQQATVKHAYDTPGYTVYYPAYNSSGTLGSNPTSTTAIYGKELTKQEYDYASGGIGTLLRTTTSAYLALSNSTYLGYNLLDLPSSIQVTGSGPGSHTTYSYDQYTLVTSGVTTQHVTPANGTYRGNLTSTSRLLSGSTTATTNCNITVSNGYLTDYKTYNDTGTVATAVDSCGTSYTDSSHRTSNTYSATYIGTLLTTQTTPPTPNVPAGLSTNYAYDFNTGLQTSVTDPNSKVEQFHYDSMLRVTEIDYPDNGQTTFSYPSPDEVNISEKMDTSGHYKTSSLLVDGVGREIRRIVSNNESAPYDQVDTYYNFSSGGHFKFKSYPYQGNGFSTARVTSGAGDTTSYDALNRTTTVTHSDSSSVLTSFTGRATSIQDEGNGTQRVQRISQVDGLGRLASVCEVSGNLTVGISGSQSAAACGQDIAATGFLTTYGYDALDNLTSVAQGPLNARTFVYDSLSRLTSSTNPEAGTITYTYDADGNVLTKKDARGTTTCFGVWSGSTCGGSVTYDALNRLMEKSYSDGTPTATYNYDQTSAMGVTLTNTIGRKSSESTAGTNASGSVFSYDPMGRVANNSQCTPQNCSGTLFSIAYLYDLLGDITSSKNGEGVTLTASYNLGARLTSLTSTLSDANHPGTLFGYTNIAHYNAMGSLASVTLGNNVNETRTYDGRQRLTGITDGSTYTLTIPTSGGYAPDSDIVGANDYVNGNWTYAYDAFNRLATSSVNSGTTTYGYLYDRFGNRWNQNVTHGTGTPSSLGFDANNHITASFGVTYDAAGDTSYDGTTTYNYDAEGRVITASNGISGSSSYVYDAEGRRIRKTTVAGGTVDFLYDLSGHEIAQVTSAGVWTRGEVYAGGRHLATYTNAPMTFFVYSDWLGTERVRSPYVAGTNETCTSLPFGDALTCTGGTDVSPMHFTGKEHDTETGLENFGARYDSSSMGRFMTPDWRARPQGVPYAIFRAPQTLNLYSFVQDNPVTVRDLDGHYNCVGSTANCAMLAEALANIHEAVNSGNLNKKEQAALNKVLSFYGKANDHNNVTVNFQASTIGEMGGGTKTVNGHTTVTLSLPNVFQDPTFRQNGASPDTEAAAQTAHEGEHGVQDQEHRTPQNKAQEKASEVEAYTVQSYVNKGEQDNSPYQVSSAGAAIWSVRGFNPEAVDYYAEKSTLIWCQEGGNCQ